MLAPPAWGDLVVEVHAHDEGKEGRSWAVLGPGRAQEGKDAQDNHEGKEGKGAQGTTPEDSDEVKDHDENKEANDEGNGGQGQSSAGQPAQPPGQRRAGPDAGQGRAGHGAGQGQVEALRQRPRVWLARGKDHRVCGEIVACA